MEPIWFRSYPPDVPRVLDPRSIGTIQALADEAFRRYAERPAYVHRDRTLTYRQLDELSRRYASFVQGRLGLRPGERIALMCPNALPFPVALFGNLRAGLVQVNVNPFYTARELRHQLNDADVATLVLVESALPVLEEILDDCPVRSAIVIRDSGLAGAERASPRLPDGVACHELGDALASPPRPMTPFPAGPDDLAFLQYTGGTTGIAKGAMLTHMNVLTGMLGFDAFTRGTLRGSPRVVVTATPLYHILGLVLNCLTFLYRGGLNLLIDDPRDTAGLVAELQRRRFNAITGVNALYNALTHATGFEEIDFSALRLAMGGGTPIQEAVDGRWFEATGVHIREGYGLSETAGLTQTPFHLERFKSTIGLPCPNLELSLRDDGGREVGLGEAGEICVRGDSVMRGYWRRESTRGEYMTADGFFKTGDVARMDEDGYLYIVDRKKDMILVSGFNVYPIEVEEVAMLMPGVVECGCVGAGDPATGESVALFVVPRADAALTAEAVKAHCRRHLVGYKVPKRVELIDALPKTAVGKVLKRELRSRLR